MPDAAPQLVTHRSPWRIVLILALYLCAVALIWFLDRDPHKTLLSALLPDGFAFGFLIVLLCIELGPHRTVRLTDDAIHLRRFRQEKTIPLANIIACHPSERTLTLYLRHGGVIDLHRRFYPPDQWQPFLDAFHTRYHTARDRSY